MERLSDWLDQDLEVYRTEEWSRWDAVDVTGPQLDARFELVTDSLMNQRNVLNLRWPNRIQGIVTGPHREALDGIGLWAWQGREFNSGFGRTAADGAFDIRVPDGSFTLDVYAGPGCSFVGWYDSGGRITTDRSVAHEVIVDGASVSGIEIRLPARPDELPRIEHCS